MKTRKYLAELIWTFALVFFWTGSVVVNQQFGGSLWLLWISLTFGIIVTSVIYIFGGISGAHINPAVTIALVFWKEMKAKKATFYIIAQVIWAILASVLLRIMFPENIWLGQTLPSGSAIQSLIMEIVMTFFLMLTILWITWQGWMHTKALAWIIIWWFIVWAILLSWPVSGGSFNPARSFAPALISWNMAHIWIYLLWPIIWSIWAMFVWIGMKGED